MRSLLTVCRLAALSAAIAYAATDVPTASLASTAVSEPPRQPYYWRTSNVGNSAQLAALFCKSCGSGDVDVPVVAVLRDSLGEGDPQDVQLTSSRLTYVWLLTYTPLNFTERLTAAVPFFCWHLGNGSADVDPNRTKPWMNLAAPQPAVASGVGRDVLQWAVLDPTGMSLRATSRAYETNAMDHERAHIDEAIADLRQAPISGYQPGLTDDELKGVIARLELRKRLLGELLTDRAAQRAGQDAGFEQERVRSRNWELLRQFAEKTGLNFEPLGIGGSTGEYALLCFPLAGAAEPKGTALEPLWKLLNIRDPWSDPRLRQWRGPTLPDANGGSIPLGVYSMAYPKMPLLLLDFRDNLHIRRRELSQRYINEITSGIIGISHFTNWYYFVGSDIYDFVTARHGSAMDQAARLDCYSRFRMALSFDRTLAPELRAEMQRRAAAASLNPLECSPAQEMELARERYDVLLRESDNGELMRQVNRDRRAEMSAFGRSQKADTSAALLHIVTFGLYTRRVPAASLDPDHLAEERAIRADLEFLKNVINAGPMPEVSFDTDLLATKIRELGRLSQSLNVPAVDRESAAVIKRVGELSKDQTLEANCDFALHVLQGETRKVVASGVSNRLPVETGE